MRLRQGLSQEQLAHRADLDRSYVGGIERGERNISLDNIYRIARALEVPPADLLGPILPSDRD
jgi:transcriptional regulator with XRE-family HTH domain